MVYVPGRLSRGAMSRCGGLVELGVDRMSMARGQAVFRPKGALPLCTAQTLDSAGVPIPGGAFAAGWDGRLHFPWQMVCCAQTKLHCIVFNFGLVFSFSRTRVVSNFLLPVLPVSTQVESVLQYT